MSVAYSQLLTSPVLFCPLNISTGPPYVIPDFIHIPPKKNIPLINTFDQLFFVPVYGDKQFCTFLLLFLRPCPSTPCPDFLPLSARVTFNSTVPGPTMPLSAISLFLPFPFKKTCSHAARFISTHTARVLHHPPILSPLHVFILDPCESEILSSITDR